MYSNANMQSSDTVRDFCWPHNYGARMEMKDRIKKARKSAELSQSALAEKVGVTRAAVAQWESGIHPPRREIIAKISDATGSDLTWLELGIEPNEGGPQRGLYVVGEVAGGLWKEGSVEFKPIGMPVAPHPDYPADCQRLYVVKGESVNRIVADGEYVHCVDVANSGIAPRHGDLVIVRRLEHGLAEYTAKRLISDHGHWVLRPESTDPLWQNDIALNGDDSTIIDITDVVIAKWSPIHRLR